MSLFDAFYRRLTGRSPAGEQRDIRRQMADLEREHGSARAAAAAVGVNKGTWWRWKTGRQAPRPANVQRVRVARRQAFVPEGARQRVRASTGRARGGLAVSGIITISADRRQRTIVLGPALPPGRLDPALDAFLAGDDERARAEVEAAASEVIGQRVEIEDGSLSFR